MPAGVDKPFPHRRHNLLMLADQPAVRTDIELRIEQRAQRVRNFLADADYHISIGLARGQAERIGLRAWNLHRVLEQLDRELVREFSGRRVMMKPDRVRGYETFGKADDPRPLRARFGYQPAGFFDGGFTVEEHRSRLHGGHPHGRSEE